MKKETLKEIMEKHVICSEEEAEEALEFIRDLIDVEIEYLQKTQPHATSTISNLRTASYEISDLLETED